MELERKNGEWLRSGSCCDLDLKRIKVRKERVDEEEEPLSPMARMFQQPESNVYVIAMMGFKSPIDPHSFKVNLVDTFLKHSRFSCVQVRKIEKQVEIFRIFLYNIKDKGRRKHGSNSYQ